MLLVADDHPLAAAASVDPATVARLPLITYRSLRAELLPTALLPRDSALNIIFRSDDDATVRALVAAGVGAALIPRLSVEPGDDARPRHPDTPVAPRPADLPRLAEIARAVAGASMLRRRGTRDQRDVSPAVNSAVP